MAWLLRRGEVLASVDVVASGRAAVRSVSSGAPGCAAAIVRGARSVHAFGAGRGVDVAYLDDALVVVARRRLSRFSLDLPRRRARSVLVAEAGSFDRWGLRAGDALELKE